MKVWGWVGVMVMVMVRGLRWRWSEEAYEVGEEEEEW